MTFRAAITLVVTSLGSVLLAQFSFAQTVPPPANVLTGVTQLSAGNEHSCAIANGLAQCWGSDAQGRMGVETNGATRPVVVPAYSGRANSISAGGRHSCAIENGVVGCWGQDTDQQLSGVDTWAINSAEAPRFPDLLQNAASVVAGAGTACAIVVGDIHCWGKNAALFGDEKPGSSAPRKLSGFSSPIVEVAANGYGTNETLCVRDSNGAVFCFGGDSARLGGSGRDASGARTPVTGVSSGAISVKVGGDHACAVLDTGSVKCWGKNSYGQLATGSPGTFGAVSAPVVASAISSAPISISLGYQYTCAAFATGIVTCWGFGSDGQLGVAGANLPNCINTGAKCSLTGVDVDMNGESVAELVSGSAHSCARLAASGRVRCWGYRSVTGGSGQRLGDGQPASATNPAPVYVASSDTRTYSSSVAQPIAVVEDGAPIDVIVLIPNPSAFATQWSVIGAQGLGSANLLVQSATAATLRYAPLLNHFGDYSVVIRAVFGNQTHDTLLPIQLLPVNDAPRFTMVNRTERRLAVAGSIRPASVFISTSVGNSQEERSQVASIFQSQPSNPALFSVPPTLIAVGPNTYTLTYTLSGVVGTSSTVIYAKDNGGTANQGVDTSANQTFTIIAAPDCKWDVDLNGSANAATDGLLMVRYMLGFRGLALTNGALGTGGLGRSSPGAIESYLFGLSNAGLLDIDGDGVVNAATDGAIMMRYLKNATSTTLTDGIAPAGFPRSESAYAKDFLDTACALQ